MKEYIRENLKSIIVVTLMVVSTTLLICTNELVAKRLPEISTLKVIDYEIEGQVFEYTGKEIIPEISSVVFRDEEGNKIEKETADITSVLYMDNINVGTADVQIQVVGYQGSLVLEDAFQIQPAQVKALEIKEASKEKVSLKWKEVAGAEGYLIYRSVDNGTSYFPIVEIKDGKSTACQDNDIQTNATYMYYVRAYVNGENLAVFGCASEPVTHKTPLSTPVMASVAGITYNTMQVQWNLVDGAVGYQVYRSLKQDGEFECIAEIADGLVNTYIDVERECGVPYYYYVKACQGLESGNVYGDASDIMSGRTTPNTVKISGVVSNNETQITLNWNQAEGAQGYEIYRSADTNSNYQLVQKIEKADVLTWTDTGLNKDTEYYYRVRAYCVVNEETITGSYSNSFLKEVVIIFDYSPANGEISIATQYAGKVPYIWGGKTSKGWDCSGFTYWVYKQHFGIDIGTTASVQARKGVVVSKNNRSEWKPGDLLVYSEGAGPSHVAIYLGNGQLIHALNEKYDTLIQDVNYYDRWDTSTTLIGVRRFFN